MKTFTLFLLALFCSLSALAQEDCYDGATPTFSTYLQHDDVNANDPALMDGLVASNGEYVTIGYELNTAAEESQLFLTRQNAVGDLVAAPILIDFGQPGEYLPIWPSVQADPIIVSGAFIEEAYDNNGTSIGYYIATSVSVTDDPTSNNSNFDVLLLQIDHTGNVQWVQHLSQPQSDEYARGLTLHDDGGAVVLIEKSDIPTRSHMAFWHYNPATNGCTVNANPLVDIPPQFGEYDFKPTDIIKASGFQDSGIQYAVCGQWAVDAKEYIGVYLLNDNLISDPVILTYDLFPDSADVEVIPRSIVKQGALLLVSGTYNIPGEDEASFIIALNPSSPVGSVDGQVIWAKRYYSDIGSSTQLKLMDSQVDSNNDVVLTGVHIVGQTEFPNLIKVDEQGEILWHNMYPKSGDAEDFGIVFVSGLELGNEGYFMTSNIYINQQSRTWTAKTGMEGELNNCDCFFDMDIEAVTISPLFTPFDYYEGDFPICELLQPVSVILSDTLDFSACDQLIDLLPNCSETVCQADTLLLNTGYNHFNTALDTIGAFNAFWALVVSPDEALNLPRPAIVIEPYSAWAEQDSTRWISAYPEATHEHNNAHPDLPYTLQNCFCVCEDASLIDFFMNVYVDDSVSIRLFTEGGILITDLLEHSGFLASGSPGVIDTSIVLDAGTYCIDAEMRNLGEVVMGLNIQGFLTGASLINPICCGNSDGTIVGTKFHDRNCNGVRDSANDPDLADHEEGLEGWNIQLCDPDGIEMATTTTDLFGYYVFNDVAPGNYIVKESQQLDWEATNIESQQGHQVILDTSQVAIVDFANKYIGPIELESSFACAVPGEEVPIRWIGGVCDCPISLAYKVCGGPGSGIIIVEFDDNPGSYSWLVPDDIESGNYELILVSCEEEILLSECFEVADLTVDYDVLIEENGFTTFSASSNPDASLSWNFGDGYTGTGSPVEHQYSVAGTYEVLLTATTDDGCEKTIRLSVQPDIRPDECGQIIQEEIDFSCSSLGLEYTYSFVFENNTDFDVTSVVMHNISPEEIMFSNSFFNLYQNPIPPGDSSDLIDIIIESATPLSQSLEVCFQVIYLTDDETCCHYEHCITLEPVNPCEMIDIMPMDTEEDCCYEVVVTNSFCKEYFSSIQTELITPGLIFTNYEENNWQTTINEDQNIINWTQFGSVPVGTLSPLMFCLDGITHIDQVPQLVAIHWLSIDPLTGLETIVCSDTIEYACEPCLLLDGNTECVQDQHLYNFTISNTSGQSSSLIAFEVQTPNIVFEPSSFEVDLDHGESFDPGTITISSIDGMPLPGGAIIEFKAILFDDEGWCCHVDGFSIELENCIGPLSPCPCEEEYLFLSQVQQGFNFDRSCISRQALLFPNHLGPCDVVSWEIIKPGQMQPLLLQSTGLNHVVFNFSSNGNYEITMNVQREGIDGGLCFDGLTGSFTQSFSIDCPPNEENSYPSKLLTLFPIPARDALFFESSLKGNIQVTILDSQGKPILETVNNNANSKVDISALPTGLFFIRLEDEEGNSKESKFIKH